MILELAIVNIKEGSNDDFEAALNKAKDVICLSKGFIKVEFKKCIENDEQYIFLIYWQTLEDHTIGFRESELFIEWRALIGPFFYKLPLVLHYQEI